MKRLLNIFIILLLFAASSLFAKSGIEIGIFVPIGMSVGLNSYSLTNKNPTKQQQDNFETAVKQFRRKSAVGFDAGASFHIGYRFEINKDMSVSVLGELGYAHDEFSFYRKSTDKNYKDTHFKIVYIDLLYLSNYLNKDTNNLPMFNDISSMLARLSMELNIKTIVTLHLPNIENKNPKLQDLMVYGAFLQAADIVGFLCDKSNNENKNDTELIVAKHRGEDLFTIKYKYDSELKKYIEI